MILEGEQMGLFRKKGRSDIDAWAKAMIQGYKKGIINCIKISLWWD